MSETEMCTSVSRATASRCAASGGEDEDEGNGDDRASNYPDATNTTPGLTTTTTTTTTATTTTKTTTKTKTTKTTTTTTKAVIECCDGGGWQDIWTLALPDKAAWTTLGQVPLSMQPSLDPTEQFDTVSGGAFCHRPALCRI